MSATVTTTRVGSGPTASEAATSRPVTTMEGFPEDESTATHRSGISRACAALRQAESSGVVTVEMKTSFMRPGLGRLVGSGRRLHRTASMAFCEASMRDAAGELVAHATGTFKYLRGLPAGGKRIQRLNASD